MKRAYSSAKRPISQIKLVAVGLYSDTNHIGILHRPEGLSNEPFFLHLGDHCKLANEKIPSKVAAWIDPDIHPMLLPHLARWCKYINELHGSGTMPYGFSSPEAFFDADGGIVEGKVGLTCSTFVLAIFHQVGIKLIDYADWPKLSFEDKSERKRMTKTIEAKDNSHALKLETDATESRYSPLQVAGAAAEDADRRPVKHSSANFLGNKIKKLIKPR